LTVITGNGDEDTDPNIDVDWAYYWLRFPYIWETQIRFYFDLYINQLTVRKD